MRFVMISLALVSGVGLPLWFLVYPRPDKDLHDLTAENIRLCASTTTIIACGLVFQGSFFLGLDGATFEQIATADVHSKSRKVVYLVYFAGSLGITFWVIYVATRLRQSRSG